MCGTCTSWRREATRWWLISLSPPPHHHHNPSHTPPPPLHPAATAQRRIVVCGPRSAVVSGAGAYPDQKPYVFIIRGSSFVTLSGFSITRGLKGEEQPGGWVRAQ